MSHVVKSPLELREHLLQVRLRQGMKYTWVEAVAELIAEIDRDMRADSDGGTRITLDEWAVIGEALLSLGIAVALSFVSAAPAHAPSGGGRKRR